MQALDHLAVVMSHVVERRLDVRLVTDARNIVRVAVDQRDFAAYMALTCDQPRRYGVGEPVIAEALLRLLATVGAATRSVERRQVIVGHVDRVLAAAERELADPEDLPALREKAASVRASLVTQPAGSAPPAPRGPQRAD